MKQRLNLYSEAFYPKVEVLTFNTFLGSCIVLIAILLLVEEFFSSKYQALQRQHSEIQALVDDKTDKLEVIENKVMSRAQDPQLVSTVSSRQSELALKQRLLSEVQGRENHKNSGFSNLLLDLARYHQSDVWLTSIDIEQDNLRFAGQAVSSTSVPSWVKRLSQAESMQGHQFAGTRVYKENDQVYFVLSSQLSNLVDEVADEN